MSPSSLVKAEPVLVGHFVTWLLVQAAAVLVGRYHLISSAAWSPLASSLEPVITAVVIGLVALLVRRVVTPAWRWVEREAPGAVDNELPNLVDEALAAAQRIYPMTLTAAPVESNAHAHGITRP